MFSNNLKKDIENELQSMRDGGLFKVEKIIAGKPGMEIAVGGKKLITLCANNYLGLSQNREVIKAAEKGLREYGLGLNSVRFIVGTLALHKKLESAIAKFFHTEDALLYSSCFDANGGVFEVLLSEGDAVFSGELNHASIIDGIRLSKAERFRFPHGNLAELEVQLIKSNARRKLIVTDGVFSMDGEIAELDTLLALATKYDALLMVDDSHGSGVLGKTGRGSIEEKGVLGKIDILTGTFGKALGGAGGGFVAGRKEIIALLRQRSRPYLFSNSLMPAIANAALFVLENFNKKFLPLQKKLLENTIYFRTKLDKLGFTLGGGIPRNKGGGESASRGLLQPSPNQNSVLPLVREIQPSPNQNSVLPLVREIGEGGGCHPIIPVMISDEVKTMALADALFKEGVYVRGFAYPVVPKGRGRIRIQIGAAHTKQQLDKAIVALEKAGKKLGIIN